jgi:hypothetical protein
VDDEIRSLHTNNEIATIRVPVGEILSNNSENGNPVRMASLLFRNMSGFLPERLHEETDINRSAQKHYSYVKFKERNIRCLLMHSRIYYNNVLCYWQPDCIECTESYV